MSPDKKSITEIWMDFIVTMGVIMVLLMVTVMVSVGLVRFVGAFVGVVIWWDQQDTF